MGILLAEMFFQAVGPHTKIILVGDADQLPSVEAGNVLHDLLRAGVPSVQLKRIFRQAAESQIITNAHRIKNGQHVTVDHTKGDFYFLKKENPKDIAAIIVRSFAKFMTRGYKINDIQVLTPQKNGVIGTIELNRVLQATVNPPSPSKPELVREHITFRVGDKVMQVKNNYNLEVFNGEIGVILRVESLYDEYGEPTGKKGLAVSYHGKETIYKNDELAQLVLAYATTIHKSQGGEWPVVIMPVSLEHYILLVRNMFYTAFTRAKEIAVLVGTDEALATAIRNKRVTQRNTRLTEKILAAGNIRQEKSGP